MVRVRTEAHVTSLGKKWIWKKLNFVRAIFLYCYATKETFELKNKLWSVFERGKTFAKQMDNGKCF